jgi:hypothetical protein
MHGPTDRACSEAFLDPTSQKTDLGTSWVHFVTALPKTQGGSSAYLTEGGFGQG